MVKRLRSSFYLKLFLSFMATCIVLFIGLALFWNYTFSDLFYKEKKELLANRAAEINRLLAPIQEGTVSVRELRLALRIIARSYDGVAWIVDNKGTIAYSSLDRENITIPKPLDPVFLEGLKGNSGYRIGHIFDNAPSSEQTLTYYMPVTLYGKQGVLFLFVPVMEISEVITTVRWNIAVPLLFSLAAVAIILYTISRKMSGPLRQMNETALAIVDGDFSKRVAIRSQDEIGQMARSFNQMVDQMEAWEDARNDFLANVSHELRSPLTTLRGFINAMNDKVIPEERYPHYLKICDFEVQRLQRLVHDLLDLARIQNGTDVFRTEPVDMGEKTKEVLEWLAPSFYAKELSVHIRLPHPEQAVSCMVDPDRFAQVLQNLLYNAIQFTPRAQSVTIEVGQVHDECIITVRDTGIGMTQDDMARIWDRFYKADHSRGERADGTGLGLTIVKHLVTGMKGVITVASEPGAGTEFTMKFPVAAVAPREQEAG